MTEKQRVEHLHVQCLGQALRILHDLREYAESASNGDYTVGDQASRLRAACTSLGAVLENDIIVEIVHTRPLPLLERVKKIAIKDRER